MQKDAILVKQTISGNKEAFHQKKQDKGLNLEKARIGDRIYNWKILIDPTLSSSYPENN